MIRTVDDTRLEDIADAIREKNRTTALLTVEDMPKAIRRMGGENGEVRFFDYDGTILQSYTAEEIAEMEELPALPQREGLICQGWNWSLDDVKAYTAKCGRCNVGAVYITDDGKTRLHIKIVAEGRMDVPLFIDQSVESGVVIDWGDGADTEVIPGVGFVDAIHSYKKTGEYTIVLNPADGCGLSLGGVDDSGNYFSVFGDSNAGEGYAYQSMLREVNIGRNVSEITRSALESCFNIDAITIPEGVTGIGDRAFLESRLGFVVLPKTTGAIGWGAFTNCFMLKGLILPANGVELMIGISNGYSLEDIVLPENVLLFDQGAFESTYSLRRITFPSGPIDLCNGAFVSSGIMEIAIPEGTATIPYRFLGYCGRLVNVIVPKSVTKIDEYAFAYSESLPSVVFPGEITTIETGAFMSCKGLKYVEFSGCTEVPYLVNVDAFDNVSSDFQIRVPDALKKAWRSANNWNAFADSIQGQFAEVKSVAGGIVLIGKPMTRSAKITKGWAWNGEEVSVSVISSDETIIKIENIVVEGDAVTYDVVPQGKEGAVNISVTVSWGGHADTASAAIAVHETAPAPLLRVEEVPDAEYGFALNESGYYESTNQGDGNTASVCKVVFDTYGIYTLSLDCINYAQSGSDYGLLSKIDTELGVGYSVTKDDPFFNFRYYHDPEVQTVEYGAVEGGEHFIFVKYRKNSTTNSQNDSLQFKVRFELV